MEKLKKNSKQKTVNLFLNSHELAEIKRLVSDLPIPPKEILADKKLAKIFTKQFAVRMNNGKKYTEQEIVTSLQEMIL